MSRKSGERVNPFLPTRIRDQSLLSNGVQANIANNSMEIGTMSDSYMEISRQNDTSTISGPSTLAGYSGADSMETAQDTADPELRRPNSLVNEKTFPYDLEGIVSKEGEMTHFVAENLEYKIKLSSPVARKDVGNLYLRHNSTPSSGINAVRSFFTPHQPNQLPQIDSNVLNDIEIEAQYLAASLDNLTENLCNLLHSVSSITADNVEIHKNAVNKLTDSMDANIKSMYTIMAKTEEISKSMKPTEQLAVRIREIKRLVDMLESNL